ncbi:MAG: CopG family transcriptional regulator [Alphaproteobacteria bacterium]|nr:CopG family transcriptional regulator [Alphaproteobacteria bacterium]
MAPETIAAAARAARAAQARALREEARAGGLRFDAYLPPALAEWLLDRIERGVFADPSEAVFAIMDEHRDLERHADLRNQLLSRSVEAAIADPPASVSEAEAETHFRQLFAKPRPAAVWRKRA